MAAPDLTPTAIAAFCDTRTPQAWVEEARARIPELLLDHANCELKAASTAIGFLYRYPERSRLAERMSRLAREELRHFEQVRKLMGERAVAYARLSASRYAATLRQAVRAGEPHRLLDSLLVGAIIEARSCERFAALIPQLPAELAGFYASLLASEARHFEEYLRFAKSETGADDATIADRVAELKGIESALITDPDPQFRFHSGVPLPGDPAFDKRRRSSSLNSGPDASHRNTLP
jgi:tRNA 2-(methylsulfanyl)-N6-isopentenyladenosine37 hydroxylase